jgi:hypothetical protein
MQVRFLSSGWLLAGISLVMTGFICILWLFHKPQTPAPENSTVIPVNVKLIPSNAHSKTPTYVHSTNSVDPPKPKPPITMNTSVASGKYKYVDPFGGINIDNETEAPWYAARGPWPRCDADGKHPAVMTYLRESLFDYKSMEILSLSPIMEYSNYAWQQQLRIRSKNRLGALTVSDFVFVIKFDQVIEKQ